MRQSIPASVSILCSNCSLPFVRLTPLLPAAYACRHMRAVNVAALLPLTLVLFGRVATPPAVPMEGRVTIAEKSGSTQDLDATVLWLDGGTVASAVPRRVEIKMYDKTFTPGLVVVPIGSTVAFPNNDGFDHNVFSRSEARAFDLGLYGRNQTRSVTFDKPGLVRVYCNVHARMSLSVLVHDGVHATRADGTGRFVFPEVAPGNYTLHAWHPRGGEASMAVTWPTDSTIAVQLDARNYRFVQHLDKDGKRYDSRGRRY